MTTDNSTQLENKPNLRELGRPVVIAWLDYHGINLPVAKAVDLMERIGAAIDSRAPVVAPQNWPTIETAPRDRTILLAGKGLEGWIQMTGYWAETDWYFVGGGWMGVPPSRWTEIPSIDDAAPSPSSPVPPEPFCNEESEQETTCANCAKPIIKGQDYWYHKYGWMKECHSDKIAATPAATSAPVEQEQRAHYESAHEARYVMTHAVHPDIVVLWFLALKSHWFDDPNNMFHGMREQAKAYLYKWVETGELADDNTTLEIATAMKFREWLQSSWTTATPSPSLAAREAAEEIDQWTRKAYPLRSGMVKEARLSRLVEILSRHPSAVATKEDGDLISRSALLGELKTSHATCIKKAEQDEREPVRVMLEHFAEAGRQIIERVETFPAHYSPVPAAGGDEDREPNPLLWVVTRAASEPCRTYARGCIENQPDQSFWCAPCAARHVIGKRRREMNGLTERNNHENIS